MRLKNVKGHVAVRHTISEKHSKYEVNSYHNQACRELAENSGLYVVAVASDGIIEAVRHERHRIMGIMWHPERENNFAQMDMDMIKRLFGEMEIKNELQ